MTLLPQVSAGTPVRGIPPNTGIDAEVSWEWNCLWSLRFSSRWPSSGRGSAWTAESLEGGHPPTRPTRSGPTRPTHPIHPSHRDSHVDITPRNTDSRQRTRTRGDSSVNRTCLGLPPVPPHDDALALRLGDSTTSSSRLLQGLPPPSNRPCRAHTPDPTRTFGPAEQSFLPGLSPDGGR